MRGAWDILNGVLKGPTQAGEKWVIPKNHIAYYLKKLKEEGVCIEMEVNAPQPEESTPRRQEDVKVDPWDLYAQAYQWAGQEVSKGKLSSRKAASEVYLRFGINLSHTTCAKILPSQNETLQNVSKCVGYDSYSNTSMHYTQKGLSNKKKRFVKRSRWHEVMIFGGWMHVTVYASVHLVSFR